MSRRGQMPQVGQWGAFDRAHLFHCCSEGGHIVGVGGERDKDIRRRVVEGDKVHIEEDKDMRRKVRRGVMRSLRFHQAFQPQ